MNQSSVAKQALESPTTVQNSNNVTSFAYIKHCQIQARRHAAFMLRQRLSGVLILVISLIVWAMTSDPSVALILFPIYSTMIISKKYVMLFNEKR